MTVSEIDKVSSTRVGFVVAPDGAAGGGMGRVKDYIVENGGPRVIDVTLKPLVTRNARGFLYSLFLTTQAILSIWLARSTGHLAFVHVNFGDKGSAARKGLIILATWVVGGRVLLHLHAVELHHFYSRSGWLLRTLVRVPFRAANLVVVLGETWRLWVVDQLGIPASRVAILWNGVPIQPRHDRDLSKGEKPVRLLFLGNLIERKGVSDLIAAMSRLPAHLPEWRLTFAGGGDVDHYRAMASGLSERIEFLGWVDQETARRLLGDSDLLVLPSYDEGLPLVVLEALGSATPVLCTPVGSIPEVLTDHENALFCMPGDVEGLARVLAEAITDRDLRVRLSAAGLDAFERRFSIDAFLASLFDIYRNRLGVQVTLIPKR